MHVKTTATNLLYSIGRSSDKKLNSIYGFLFAGIWCAVHLLFLLTPYRLLFCAAHLCPKCSSVARSDFANHFLTASEILLLSGVAYISLLWCSSSVCRVRCDYFDSSTLECARTFTHTHTYTRSTSNGTQSLFSFLFIFWTLCFYAQLHAPIQCMPTIPTSSAVLTRARAAPHSFRKKMFAVRTQTFQPNQLSSISPFAQPPLLHMCFRSCGG